MKAADLLADLIALPTQQGTAERPAGNELALCQHLVPLLAERGADQIEIGKAPRSDGSPGAYVFARWGTPRRVINAHVDTVPANAGWSRPPHEPHRTADRIYGLGAADTKGAIAATLIALEEVEPVDAGVLFSGDEEAGSAVLHAFLASDLARDIREVIVCEPTARTAGIAHRGVLCQRAKLTGQGGHSSKADHMPRPFAQLARLAVSLDELARARISDGPSGMTGVCLNLAGFFGGVAFNVIPQEAELEWSLRPYPGFDRAAWDREITSRAHAIDPSITISAPLDHGPFACDKLAAAVRPHVTSIGSLDFWTEAALYAAHNIDAIVVGPGDISQAHAADEFVTYDDLAWATKLYAALLAGE
jgi:acetylornithine deacetylase